MDLQPFLHTLHAAIHAPTQAWSAADGQIRGLGAEGVYHADVRVLAEAVVTIGGAEPETVEASPVGGNQVHVVAAVRAVDAPGADPTARLDRVTTVGPHELTEVLRISCSTAEPVAGHVVVRLRPDATGMELVKGGRSGTVPPVRLAAGGAAWTSHSVEVALEAPGAQLSAKDDHLLAQWDVEARTGEPTQVTWNLRLSERDPVVTAPARPQSEWSVPTISSADSRLAPFAAQALADLGLLRMTAAFAPDDVFICGGAPWFFTLFGRDALWAARMLLPLGTELAGTTLRTLAAKQGARTDPETAEQPGKILHEVRRSQVDFDAGFRLPPVYYGTIDATALWVCLLHDAWRWGMPDDEVVPLLPACEAALAWMADSGDADGDGFIEYIDETGRGLANQGWKDSGDSVQWRDGRLATGTIALSEVQGYAYEAAVGGAALLDAFGRPGADRWREWAAGLADRFRRSFWVHDESGDYPGIALDGEKRLVDTVTSNMGHLLGTGILSADEEDVVAARLVRPDMSSGRGLRTMSTQSAGYWPLRYHGGTVWPHDTAIAVTGLARTGHDEAAATLADGLLTAAMDFDWRLPELWSGDSLDEAPRSVPYPAACRPQAWSAGCAVAVLAAELGLAADVPGGVLRVHPARTAARPLDVRGLRLAGRPLDVHLHRDDTVEVHTDAPVSVHVVGAS